MKTLIVEYNGFVRFLVTNHPEHRFSLLQGQMPVGVFLSLKGSTDVKAKDIKLRFSTQQYRDTVWFRLNDEFERYLSEIT